MKENLKKEMARKTIHISGLLYIPSMIYLGKDFTAIIVAAITITAILFEFSRRRRRTAIDGLLRDYERKRIPGYIYTGVAFSAITPFFSTEACIVSAVAAFAGDGVAGIVKRVRPGLAVPAFILPCLTLILLLPVNPVYALISVLISSLLDGRRWEDNLTIPISAALSYELLRFML
ncbi:hypothetical protein [Geoglobus acetivorans]|uniref:Dolichol kinase n=1 Tax=Geoglobus acetivorans TaxID=565033 RepID=A0ABZ3H0T1_GEOAI|nr:hypothetical protein [Geoglobus acetivorans]